MSSENFIKIALYFQGEFYQADGQTKLVAMVRCSKECAKKTGATTNLIRHHSKWYEVVQDHEYRGIEVKEYQVLTVEADGVEHGKSTFLLS